MTNKNISSDLPGTASPLVCLLQAANHVQTVAKAYENALHELVRMALNNELEVCQAVYEDGSTDLLGVDISSHPKRAHLGLKACWEAEAPQAVIVTVYLPTEDGFKMAEFDNTRSAITHLHQHGILI